MKQIKNLLLIMLLAATVYTQAQPGVGIGTSTPDATALLDVSSTSQGVLLPRMTALQRDSIPSPAAGLIVWCTDCGDGELQLYNGTWKGLSMGTTAGGVFMNTLVGADIDGEAESDFSGHSVSLSADGVRVAIGAYGNDGNGSWSGHVRIYQWDGNSWGQLGADIDGETADDYSGWSVSLSADGVRVAIGAYVNDGNGFRAGHVRIYQWDGNSWGQLGADIDGEAESDFSGYSVSLSADGARVAIGAYGNDGNGSAAGHVRIYQWDGNSWGQLGADIDGEAAGDRSGWSVSLSADGARVAIGAYRNFGTGSWSGHVRVYLWNGSSWGRPGTDIDGEAANDESGTSVSLSADGSKLAIGAPYNDGSATNSGHVRVFQ